MTRDGVVVHPHAFAHGLTRGQIVDAWLNFACKQKRTGGYWAAIGFDRTGREIELVAAELEGGRILVIHAISPATRALKQELGLYGR